MKPKKVTLNLTLEEALVLFEFLTRYSDSDRLSIADPAEQQVLWELTSKLEKILEDPFSPDYRDKVRQARDSLTDATQTKRSSNNFGN